MKPFLPIALFTCAVLGLVRPVSAADTPAVKAPPTEVILIEHGKVDNAFTTGTGGYFEVNSLFKVIAARRVAAPAPVEIHTRDTDVFYIVDGSATFVTGGTPVGQKETKPGELSAKSITGGTERHLTKGDVLVIPPGIPHQFLEVTNPFLYFVVKVTQ